MDAAGFEVKLGLTSLTNRTRKVVALSKTERRYLFTALTRLFLARLEFSRKTASQIIASFSDARCTADPTQHRSSLDVPTVGWAIGIAAGYAPWRADCLIQAMAAHRWLRGHGYRTSFVLGVVGEGEGLAAHVWLKCEGFMVTGGESTSQYRPLVVSSKPPLDFPLDVPPDGPLHAYHAPKRDQG